MIFRIQCSKKENSDSLCRLFQSEKNRRDHFLWQDRRPHFFDLYKSFSSDWERIFCVVESQVEQSAMPFDPLGASPLLESSTVLAPIEDGSFFWKQKDWNLWYDGDCFMLPDSRSQKKIFELIRQRQVLLRDAVASGTYELSNALFCGIENKWGFLSRLADDSSSFLGHFIFGPETRLSDIYPLETDPLLNSVLGDTDVLVERLRVDSIKPETLESLQHLEKEDSSSIQCFPRLSENFLFRLSQMDPEAQIFLAKEKGQIVAACTVADMGKVRRFRRNKNALIPAFGRHPLYDELLVQKEDRPMDPSLREINSKQEINSDKQDELIRSLVIGRWFQTEFQKGSPTAKESVKTATILLLREVARDVIQRGYHNFFLRDGDKDLLDRAFQRTYHFPRRSVFWTFDTSRQGPQLLGEIQQGHLTVRWDNHCL